MAKVILICGKIASGKTYYANTLCKQENTVLLSCDELMLKLFPEPLGAEYDTYSLRAREYLHHLAEHLICQGTDVILDWGFWSRGTREQTTQYYRSRGIAREWHYIDISEESWKQHIEKRNREVAAGTTRAYAVDEGLLAKMNRSFEVPEKDEIDVWHTI